jgi:hypothetical protein
MISAIGIDRKRRMALLSKSRTLEQRTDHARECFLSFCVLPAWKAHDWSQKSTMNSRRKIRDSGQKIGRSGFRVRSAMKG